MEGGDISLWTVDWEFAQFGHRACDIGQMIGDLYEREHFKNVDGALWAIDAFIKSYGILSDEMAFHVTILTDAKISAVDKKIKNNKKIGLQSVLLRYSTDIKSLKFGIFCQNAL